MIIKAIFTARCLLDRPFSLTTTDILLSPKRIAHVHTFWPLRAQALTCSRIHGLTKMQWTVLEKTFNEGNLKRNQALVSATNLM